jgi:4-aminobutyrate aminotransferase-like enzyme
MLNSMQNEPEKQSKESRSRSRSDTVVAVADNALGAKMVDMTGMDTIDVPVSAGTLGSL